MKKKYNFTRFILEHVEDIFGKTSVGLGKPIVVKYKDQINALDIKLNEAIEKNDLTDKTFILGLFDLTISQFAVTLKTNVDDYKLYFFDFLDGK